MKVYVGMMRPDFIHHPGGYVACPCGQILRIMETYMNHWRAGHFDYPVYKEISDDDILKLAIEQKKNETKS